jgi:hypothetical protein
MGSTADHSFFLSGFEIIFTRPDFRVRVRVSSIGVEFNRKTGDSNTHE